MGEEQQTLSALVGVVLDGSYRIERLLGEGGMGAVYHATQLRLDKPVAVKVMARELSAAPEALARFHREALVTSNLGHPNIVQVFDFSTTSTGEPFLVMEFLDGEDLEHRLRREGRLSPPAMLHIIRQVAAALMATHGKGIVHRDLKPANIYLLAATGAGDFVKVLDFGISKVRSATTKLTRTTSIMGTPGYMSPEQASGKVEDIDETTDQWALACITWECLAGEVPFSGESPLATLFQVVHEPPPPLLPKVPGLHPKVEDVLLRALSKKKSERFASVSDFVAALEEAVTGATSKGLASVPLTMRLSEAGTAAGPVGKPAQSTTFTQTTGELNDEVDLAIVRSRAWIWAVVGAATIILIGTFLLLRPRPAPKPVAASTPPAASAPVSTPVRKQLQMPVAPTPGLVPSQPPATTDTTAHASPEPSQSTQEMHGTEAKAGSTAVPAKSPRKHAHPVARRPHAKERMIEDL